jgi:hypothetical protein
VAVKEQIKNLDMICKKMPRNNKKDEVKGRKRLRKI